MNLSDMRGRLRQDLHDEDATNERWTDAELDRHIERSVREFSLAVPLETKSTLITTADSRDLSISGLTELVSIAAVEYPVDQYPPAYVRFSVWESTLTLLVDSEPAASENVNVYYTKLHTIDISSSMAPPRFEGVIATNRVNVGGQDVWQEYLTWGEERLADFQRELARHGRRNALRARRLYPPATPSVDQSTVVGP